MVESRKPDRMEELPAELKAPGGHDPSLEEFGSLKRELESLRVRLVKLSEASIGVTGSLEVDTVLQAVIDGARALTNARYGAILTLDHFGGIENFLTSGMSLDERQQMEKTPQGLGILGYLNEITGPLRLADIASHPRSAGFPENHPAMKSFLGAPMRCQGKHMGNIYLAEKEGGEEFTQEDEEILAMFASQGAASIANVHSYRMANLAKGDLEAMLNICPVAVMVFDPKTRDLLSFNPEAKRIVFDQHVAGRSLNDLLDAMTFRRPNGQDIPLEELPTERVIRRGETVRAEEIVVHLPDGRSIPTLCNATAVRGEDGEIVSVVATLQDMTPLENLEKQRGQFLGMLSQELRNPIASIKGSVATLLDPSTGLPPAETNQFLRIIDQQADHLRNLIGNLVDIGRIEAGTLSVDTETVEAAALIEEARRVFLRSGARSIVTVNIGQPLPAVLADRQRIIQALISLFSYTSTRSPDWSVIEVNASFDDLHVVVSVADEGKGVAPERLPHLFRRYPPAESGGREGTEFREGLSLTICKGIVEAHGGRIWAESDGAGRPTRFLITIPAAPTPGRRPSDEPGGTTDRARVVAFASEPTTLQSIRRSLSDAGYTPVVTSDPAEAVHLAETAEPALILMDSQMMRPNRFELIKRLSDAGKAPLVFLADRDDDEFLIRAIESGAEDYIARPFSPSELASRIKVLMRRRTAQSPTRTAELFLLGDLTIDYLERTATVAGQKVGLTPTEYRLLHELSMNAGTVLTYEHLLRRIWNIDYSSETQVVRTFVKNLRRKLGDKPNNPAYIITVPRTGYRMPRP